MPCSDTSNFAKPFVSLARELLRSPTVGNTLESMTLGDSNNVHTLILLEDCRNLYWFLEESLTELNLIGNGTAVKLNLHQVRLLLAETSLPDLSVGKDTNNSAIFADTFEFASDGLATILSMLLGVACEGLFLRPIPVLVEATFNFVRKM